MTTGASVACAERKCPEPAAYWGRAERDCKHLHQSGTLCVGHAAVLRQRTVTAKTDCPVCGAGRTLTLVRLVSLPSADEQASS